MDDCFIERETLGELIDTLLAQKYPGTPAMELAEVRETNIKKLDDHIVKAVFGSLSEEKLNELSSMLDKNENNPMVFQAFFRNSGIDLEQVISDAAKEYSSAFLGGQNA